MLILDLNEVKEVTDHINKFCDFLIACWPLAHEVISKDHNDKAPVILAKWVQANWEFLVERELLGTKSHVQSVINKERTTFPNANTNHILFCRIVTDQEATFKVNPDEFLLVSIGTIQEGNAFKPALPFDYIKVADRNNIEFFIPIHKCKFFIKCCQISQDEEDLL